MAELVWENVEQKGKDKHRITPSYYPGLFMERAMFPGGWLLRQSLWKKREGVREYDIILTFVPDPNHEWK